MVREKWLVLRSAEASDTGGGGWRFGRCVFSHIGMGTGIGFITSGLLSVIWLESKWRV